MPLPETPRHAGLQLASFMRDVNSKIAREVGGMHGWKEKIWGRRYTDIVASHDPDDQVQRLRYLLEQGCQGGTSRGDHADCLTHQRGRPIEVPD